MPPEAEEILRQESAKAGVTVDDLLRVTHSQKLSRPRRQAFRRMRDEIQPRPSYGAIAAWVGRWDMTVIKAIEAARRD
jgi:hypothetical protein